MFTKDMNTQDRKCRDLIPTLLYRLSLVAIAKPKKVVTFFLPVFFYTISSNDIVTLDLKSISMLVTLDYLMAWGAAWLRRSMTDF